MLLLHNADFVVGITCFATVGMFSAVSNLGAGGISDVSLSDTANGVLYGCFAVMGLFAGGITNGVYPGSYGGLS